MQTRREALKTGLVAAGALGAGTLLATPAHAFNKAAFSARTVQAAVKALGGNSFTESKAVSLQGPEIAENGAVVPVSVAATLPGVRKIALLVENNPNALVAVFDVNEWVEPNFAIRCKMSESSDVYAVALTEDGKAYYAKKEIKVTLGGCGG